ncbi:MAG: hypothetical protein DWH79_10130 [Planctomycetota bacterium]|nr:MAG: hypothetical protein DWH79_10130 [Planctomycetota bacterium]
MKNRLVSPLLRDCSRLLRLVRQFLYEPPNRRAGILFHRRSPVLQRLRGASSFLNRPIAADSRALPGAFDPRKIVAGRITSRLDR